MKKIVFTLFLLLLLKACTENNESQYQSSYVDSKPLQFLQRSQPSLRTFDTPYNGKVVIHNGCISLTNKGSNHFTVAIWPKEFKLQVENNNFVIYDENGRLIGRDKASVRFKGMYTPHYKELDMRMSFPENCRAKNYFIVGLE